MFGWLRSAGDLARINKELEALGVNPRAIPENTRKQITQICQEEIDAYGRLAEIGNFPSIDRQSHFDTVFEEAAQMVILCGLPYAAATNALGERVAKHLVASIANGQGRSSFNFHAKCHAALRAAALTGNPSLDEEIQRQDV